MTDSEDGYIAPISIVIKISLPIFLNNHVSIISSPLSLYLMVFLLGMGGRLRGKPVFELPKPFFLSALKTA